MRIRFAIPTLLVLAAIGLTGCVDNSTPAASDSGGAANDYGVTKDAALAASVPASIVSAGKLPVGSDLTYAPNEFKDDNGNPVGWEVDLTHAIAAKLGLGVDIVASKFDNIIPSVSGGKYDLGVSSFTDTAEREQQVDMISYYSAGSLWAAPAGKTVNPDDACGLKVAVQTTTVQDTEELPARSKACTDAGKPAIEALRFDAQDQVTNAVVLGQADAMTVDSPVALYAIAQTKGKLEAAGQTFDVAPYGMVVAKGAEFGPVLQKTLQALVDDGTYGKILTKWGVADGGVTTIGFNSASKG